jgi:hypothetical protein
MNPKRRTPLLRQDSAPISMLFRSVPGRSPANQRGNWRGNVFFPALRLAFPFPIAMPPTVAVDSRITRTGAKVTSGARPILRLSGWMPELSARSSARKATGGANPPTWINSVSAFAPAARFRSISNRSRQGPPGKPQAALHDARDPRPARKFPIPAARSALTGP